MILLSTAARTGASQGRAVLLSGTEMWSDTAFLSKGRIFCFRMKFGWECIGYFFFFFQLCGKSCINVFSMNIIVLLLTRLWREC